MKEDEKEEDKNEFNIQNNFNINSYKNNNN